MKILITGIGGFAASSIAKTLLQSHSNFKIIGLDNFSRKGSEQNISRLIDMGVKLIRADIRAQSDIDALPQVDWVIDCAANPSVLAGLDGQSSSRQLLENNLLGTINLLEYCKRHKAGLILLSTSRVYSASIGGMKMFTTYMAMMNHSMTFLGKKGSVAGVALGTSLTTNELDVIDGLIYFNNQFLGLSLTGFYTKSISVSPKLSISPMLAVSSPF